MLNTCKDQKKASVNIGFLLISEMGVFSSISNLKNMKIKVKTRSSKDKQETIETNTQNNVELRPSFEKKPEIFEFNPEIKTDIFLEHQNYENQQNLNFLGWISSKDKQKNKSSNGNPKIKIKKNPEPKKPVKEKTYTNQELKKLKNGLSKKEEWAEKKKEELRKEKERLKHEKQLLKKQKRELIKEEKQKRKLKEIERKKALKLQKEKEQQKIREQKQKELEQKKKEKGQQKTVKKEKTKKPEKKIETKKEFDQIVLEKKKTEPEAFFDEDVKKILPVIDNLLEKLPEEVIDKFAQSKDFALYEKVVNKYKSK